MGDRPDWVPQEDWDQVADLRSALETLSCVTQKSDVFGYSLSWTYRPGQLIATLSKTGTTPYTSPLGVTKLACLGTKTKAAKDFLVQHLRLLYSEALYREFDTQIEIK